MSSGRRRAARAGRSSAERSGMDAASETAKKREAKAMAQGDGPADDLLAPLAITGRLLLRL